MEKVLVIDSRQQSGKHNIKDEYFNHIGIRTLRSKLFVGDYAYLHNQSVVIDTKKDLVEVANNITKGHERFRAECERAKDNGIELIILIEEDIKTSEDLCKWESTRTQVKGNTILKIMQTMSERYNVMWRFCSKEKAGEKILYLLDHYGG